VDSLLFKEATMGWQENMYDALAEMLREQMRVDAVSVTGFEDYTASGGYCESCWYEETRCRIDYVDSKGNSQTYDYYDSFGELVKSLS
jgi:hypothetical protein